MELFLMAIYNLYKILKVLPEVEIVPNEDLWPP